MHPLLHRRNLLELASQFVSPLVSPCVTPSDHFRTLCSDCAVIFGNGTEVIDSKDGPVAQMDRATVSYTAGRRFDSARGLQSSITPAVLLISSLRIEKPRPSLERRPQAPTDPLKRVDQIKL